MIAVETMFEIQVRIDDYDSFTAMMQDFNLQLHEAMATFIVDWTRSTIDYHDSGVNATIIHF